MTFHFNKNKPGEGYSKSKTTAEVVEVVAIDIQPPVVVPVVVQSRHQSCSQLIESKSPLFNIHNISATNCQS